MTSEEFNREFDVLYNNVASNMAPELNGYEKSVFLTEAQNQFVLRCFNHNIDSTDGGYDGSQKRQYDLSSITKVSIANPVIFSQNERMNFVSSDAIIFKCPDDCFLIVNESVFDDTLNSYVVKPINYQEYERLMGKPYKYPFKREAWRLTTNAFDDEYIEIIGRFKGEHITYKCRYVPILPPIIIEDLSTLMSGLTINGYSEVTECILPEECHRTILELAVMRAKQAWMQNTATADMEGGQR